MVHLHPRWGWCAMLLSVIRSADTLQEPASPWSSGRSAISSTGIRDRKNNGITVASIPRNPLDATTSKSVTAVADLRYNEWIRDEYIHVSRSSFQAATMDMYHERVVQGGATIVLAQKHQLPTSDGQLDETEECNAHEYPAMGIVGTAEFSHIELEGALFDTNRQAVDHFGRCLYVTDLVTCRMHRRQGVALALMRAIEELVMPQPQVVSLVTKARTQNSRRLTPTTASRTTLLLHVEPVNLAALQFYQGDKMGYCIVDSGNGHGSSGNVDSTLDIRSVVNVDRLAENAGVTSNQVLLYKTLGALPSTSSRQRQGGRGFSRH